MKKIENPVLRGFHPDPCLLFANDTFYVANSTFEYYPSVMLSSSKDLANWKNLGGALYSQLKLEGNPQSGGVWAPCLSYNDGLFYIVYTDVKSWANYPFKDTHNYISVSKNIEGPYSDGIYINSSGFDPSLFHDSDGKKYFVNMQWDWRESDGEKQFSGIIITELDPKSLKPIGTTKNIFAGTKRSLTEGPHIFKRNNYYYLVTAEGGTSYEHSVTIARSKNIYGPYEVHPNVHLASSYDSPLAPLQKTGHGSICKGRDDRWWLATLCGRSMDLSLCCPLGRETAINEIVWVENWPYLLNESQVMDEFFEGYGEKEYKNPIICYDFSKDNWEKDFMSLRKPCDYRIDGEKLVIRGGESIYSNFNQNMLALRQTEFDFTFTTHMNFESDNFQKMAGINYRYSEECQYYFFITYNEKFHLHSLNIIDVKNWKAKLPLGKNGLLLKDYRNSIYLRLNVQREIGYFYYSFDNCNFTKIDSEIDVHYISDEGVTPMGFTGAFIALEVCDLQDGSVEASFDNLVIEQTSLLS